MSIFEKRLGKVQCDLKANQAALVTDDISIFYFTGLPNSEGSLFITRDESYLLVDFRYIEDDRYTKFVMKREGKPPVWADIFIYDYIFSLKLL